MAERSFHSPEHPELPEPPLVSRLQARFDDLDDGLDLPSEPQMGAGGPSAAVRTTGTRAIDDLYLQLEVLRGQLDAAFDDVDRRLEETETRASVAEARASVAEARASVAETRAGDAESRMVHLEDRLAELAGVLESIAPDGEPATNDVPTPTSFRGALDRLRERLEA